MLVKKRVRHGLTLNTDLQLPALVYQYIEWYTAGNDGKTHLLCKIFITATTVTEDKQQATGARCAWSAPCLIMSSGVYITVKDCGVTVVFKKKLTLSIKIKLGGTAIFDALLIITVPHEDWFFNVIYWHHLWCYMWWRISVMLLLITL